MPSQLVAPSPPPAQGEPASTHGTYSSSGLLASCCELATTLIGLAIDVPARGIRVRPALPARVDRLRIMGLVVCGASRVVELLTSGGRALASVKGAPEGFQVESSTG